MRCAEEFPLVEKVMEKFKDEELTVIALGFQDTRENIKGAIEKKGIEDFIYVYDKDAKVAKQFGIALVAASVFIDRAGIVRKTFPGGFNKSELIKATYKIIN